MPTGQRVAVASRLAKGWRRRTIRPLPGRSASAPTIGQAVGVFNFVVRRTSVQGWHLYGLSLSSIALCVGLWIRAKTVGEDERGNAERRALFVGLWPPMFWLIGNTLDQRRSSSARLGRRPRALRPR